MESQHCIAWSGVMVATQSNAYVVRLSASNARNIGLANRMFDYISSPVCSRQACGHQTFASDTARRINVDKSPSRK